ncbi:unnamed protein product [Caenorhabditis auriculariae]|uniref:Uncharacterized protein n=1 Tax=Caenorhabditis auriculariae TaxID=2777116 RepID=A0A8S1GV07_9PELO|nr:unnamed protein product [Caenorhabditis auriculariae]
MSRKPDMLPGDRARSDALPGLPGEVLPHFRGSSFLSAELVRSFFHSKTASIFWRCNLKRFLGKLTYIQFGADPMLETWPRLRRIFLEHNVTEESLNYIEKSLSSGKTAHTTVGTKARNFLEKRLRSSPYLMELLVRMFYHDFLLFNYKLPDGF